jgi:hypothetical protein
MCICIPTFTFTFILTCGCGCGCAQCVFGTSMGDLSGLSEKQVYRRALDRVAATQQQYTVLPLALTPDPDLDLDLDRDLDLDLFLSGTPLPLMNLLQHGHFINYAGAVLQLLLE